MATQTPATTKHPAPGPRRRRHTMTQAAPSQAEVVAGRCQAQTKQGQSCAANPAAGSAYCAFHDPARAAAQAQARKRGGHNRQTAKAADVLRPAKLRTTKNVMALLEEVLADTRLQENSAQRSRTLISLALAALKALEVGELEERLAALELAYKEAGSR